MSCFERGSWIETIVSNTKSALLPKCHAGLLREHMASEYASSFNQLRHTEW